MKALVGLATLLVSGLSCFGAGSGGVIADYAGVLQEASPRADGQAHFDTPAMIASLRKLHVNTYFFLIHSDLNWNDLRDEFLPAAAAAGIDVWLYFVPPSECPAPACHLPFDFDYVKTAEEIARLALARPNLKGLAIDDFSDNVKLFTPEYVAKMSAAGKAVNRQFRFYPLLYWKSMQPAFLDSYAAGMDGVIMAYRDEPTTNTSRNTSLREQLTECERLLSTRGKATILMIYCSPLGSIPIPPGVEYVRSSVAMALEDIRQGKLAGVVTYQLRKNGGTPNRAHSGTGQATMLVSGRGIGAGEYAEISRTVMVDKDANSISFWCSPVYARLTAGYLALQVLLDDSVVWERDLAGIAPKVWEREQVKLAGAAEGAKRTLRLRLMVKQKIGSMAASVGLDDLAGEGVTVEDPGFETGAGWDLKESTASFLAMVEKFDSGRPQAMFEAVSKLYAGAVGR